MGEQLRGRDLLESHGPALRERVPRRHDEEERISVERPQRAGRVRDRQREQSQFDLTGAHRLPENEAPLDDQLQIDPRMLRPEIP